MRLNKLSYQIIELDDESIKNGYFVDNEDFSRVVFEFLIDGETISSLLKTKHKAIPYFYFENDLPVIHKENKELHLICVCSCGVDGCGRVTCELERSADFVIFRNISKDGVELLKNFKFRFSRENYDSVITEIIANAGEYKNKYESKDESSNEN